jgi:hypothetical protein
MADVEGFDPRYLDESKQKDTVIPRFYIKSVRNETESKRTGSVVYEDREYVELRVPGDKLNIIVTKVDDNHRRRWPQYYKAFVENRVMKPDGFPLNAWAIATPALISTLAELNCHTVEQLAGLPETSLPRFQGMLKIQQQAREFLKSKEDAQVISRLQHSNDTLQERLSMQDDTIKALKDRLLALEAGQPAPEVKRGPGRPRKVQ